MLKHLLVTFVAQRAQRSHSDKMIWLAGAIGLPIGFQAALLPVGLDIITYQLDWTSMVISKFFDPAHFRFGASLLMWIIMGWFISAPFCRILQISWPMTFDNPDFTE